MAALSTILNKIIKQKLVEIAARKSKSPQRRLVQKLDEAPPVRGFFFALNNCIETGRDAVIAEIKYASPSVGIIREDFDPIEIAQSYLEGGAACLSILTDETFFRGSDAYLKSVRTHCRLPLLRKDFIIDPYQVYEARILGADCILLIVAILSTEKLRDLYALATNLNMDVLVEVHDKAELDIALTLHNPLIGINNRDLHTFKTTLKITFDLIPHIPKHYLVVTESGIHSREDVDSLREHDVNAFLVGEAFMRSVNPGSKIKALFRN
tara:strand:+ start:616 stop:1416 length:801 start_codon:yes stop_codon:yes gene_type:complete